MTDDRPIVLLLHDGGRAADQWREFVPLLESRFRVLAPDLPTGDIGATLDHLGTLLDGERCGVIGHGTGKNAALPRPLRRYASRVTELA